MFNRAIDRRKNAIRAHGRNRNADPGPAIATQPQLVWRCGTTYGCHQAIARRDDQAFSNRRCPSRASRGEQNGHGRDKTDPEQGGPEQSQQDSNKPGRQSPDIPFEVESATHPRQRIATVILIGICHRLPPIPPPLKGHRAEPGVSTYRHIRPWLPRGQHGPLAQSPVPLSTRRFHLHSEPSKGGVRP